MSYENVDQEQFESARRAQSLLNTLLEDPKHGLTVKKIVKDKFPDARIPDLEFLQQVGAPIQAKMQEMEATQAALRAELEQVRNTQAINKATRDLKKSLDQVKSEYGFTDEGMAQVVETMKTRNLAHDPEAAAALVQSKMPKPKPASSRSSLLSPNLDIYGMQGQKSDHYDKLHSHPWSFFEDECVAVFDEHAAAGM